MGFCSISLDNHEGSHISCRCGEIVTKQFTQHPLGAEHVFSGIIGQYVEL